MSLPALTRRTVMRDVAERQDGVLTRAQLRELGYDREAVRSQVTARRWQAMGPRVVVLHNGPLTPRQQRWCARHGRPAACWRREYSNGWRRRHDCALNWASPPGPRHRSLLSLVLGGIEGGADSFAEIDFGRLARRAGLAPPRRQVFRLDRAGRRRWLDADFGSFSAEVDGRCTCARCGTGMTWSDRTTS